LPLHKKVVPLRRKIDFCITLTNLINYKTMIVVPVKEGENIERALKKFKRKFEKTGVVKELRARQQFDKPSVKNRLKMERAIYVQQLQRVED
jgi:small subunit ribosomal protein S21